MLKKIIFIFLLLITSYTLNAQANDQRIECPSPSTLRNAVDSMNQAELTDNSGYVVFTAHRAFHESNLPWVMGVNSINARSYDEALKIGKDLMRKVHLNMNQYAESIEPDHYRCWYDNNRIVAVGGNLVEDDLKLIR